MAEDHSENYGRRRQREIYSMGTLADQPPEFPVRYEELERRALESMDDRAAGYVAGGAGGEDTAAENRLSFADWRLLPRMLTGVAERDLQTELLGEEFEPPLALAPVGIQTLLHEEGELATARAAAQLGTPFCLSSVASVTMEAVAEELGEAPAWFQLYPSSDRAITESFLTRAEASGFDALVVTVDVPALGWRERDIEHGYLPQLDGEGLANYFADPVFRERLDQPPEENEGLAIQEFLDAFGDPGLDWEGLEDIVASTELPVVLKGVLHPDDAERAVEAGVDAVAVSNHGGRQVDGAVGALAALPRVAERVGYRVDVTFDSGVRRGADVIKALALGADCVMVGRPYLYGLALAGEEGVRTVMENLRADLDLTLANLGYPVARDLDRDAVVARGELQGGGV
jgi:isopentenyl-diphosphate delta-isomerase